MNTCVLCFKPHNNLWRDEPNMYCEQCVPIRDTARNKADNITDNVYLGDMMSAATFDGIRVCVHERGPTYHGQCLCVPVLTSSPRSKYDRTGAVASIAALDAVSDLIESYVGKDEKIIVHCYGGIERSPLALVWWLTRSKRYDNINEAYEFIKTKRPAVSPRLFWLPTEE